MYFPSKKDIWHTFLMWGTIFIIFFLPLHETESYFSIARLLLLLIAIQLLWFWFRTGYSVKDGKLKAIYGPYSKTVMISDIQKISKSNNLLAAPALAIDRLNIHYGKYDTLLISPKNEQEFIILLLQENVQIQLDDKVRSN